ncbi:nickel/cobalt efflux transporter [Cupriavidus metallidurans]|uniref:nickel/cobalt efflux transporter n=1 Tax=Cupriavidus metallidurans TaxID=119219 RepID=UPI0004931EE9|nr:nickel/cobalt efflux transporter [Cupriavidus metallidurans]
MTDFATLIQQGTASAWLFIPSAILLGALHGLEPGHSKTMMAAFIVAIRGTVGQAVLLGISATISHTAVVWVVAMLGLYFGQKWSAEATEPYLQLGSAVLIVGVALWMMWRTWREESQRHETHQHTHGGHHDEVRHIDTGHGFVRLEIFEEGVPPRFRLHAGAAGGHRWAASQVKVQTKRQDGKVQVFSFTDKVGFLESRQEIPEPHEFAAQLQLGHGDHTHNYDVRYTEADHGHMHEGVGLDVASPGFQDDHERAHADQIRRRFASRQVTTGQIIVFGLTGGLIPCPAAITVLLLCLQLKEVTLGAALVLCFSIGLALTLVLSGAVAAIGARHAAKKWSGFGEIVRRAPYVSGGLILLVGLYVGYHGYVGLVKG